MSLLTRIKTESILHESDIKELIEILISPSIGTDIKYELLSNYSEREIQQQELTYIVRSLINTMYPHQPCYEGSMCVCGTEINQIVLISRQPLHSLWRALV